MSNSVSSAPATRRAGGMRPTIPVRVWATPLTIAAFVLMAATGVLMFFGWRQGLTSEVHEWFSWIFLAGAFGHIVANIRPFTSHLKSRWGRISIAASVALLSVCILPFHGPHQLRGVVEQSVRDAPLSTLASSGEPRPRGPQDQVEGARNLSGDGPIRSPTVRSKPLRREPVARDRVHGRLSADRGRQLGSANPLPVTRAACGPQFAQ